MFVLDTIEFIIILEKCMNAKLDIQKQIINCGYLNIYRNIECILLLYLYLDKV
jgi:hypothetical protein